MFVIKIFTFVLKLDQKCCVYCRLILYWNVLYDFNLCHLSSVVVAGYIVATCTLLFWESSEESLLLLGDILLYCFT